MVKGRILIVGGSGFLGRHLSDNMAEYRLVGTCFRHPSSELVYLDLREQRQIDAILSSAAPSIVIYAAGLTDVEACERNPKLARQLNTEAVAVIAKYPGIRTVYFSTDYVFDGRQGLYEEHSEPAPLNVYALSKLAGERAVLSEDPENLVIRVSGLYDSAGMRNRSFDSRSHSEVYADDTRLSTPVHVDDVVRAVKLLLERSEGGIYHAVGPDVLSRYEFEQLVSLHFPKSPAVAPSASLRDKGIPRPQNSSLTANKLKSIGWRPRPVCDGLLPVSDYGVRCFKPGIGPGTEERYPKALLIDCVGALLARRTWLAQDTALDDLDEACAKHAVGSELWKEAAKSLGFDASLEKLKERITSRYVPNPPVWNRLRSWRSRYRLALVNNGPADTFRRWVTKYGLEDVFDVIGNSEEMGVEKSNSEFFLRVARELGVRPQDCLLIDDDNCNAVAAKRCGMRSVTTIERHGYPISEYVWNTAENTFPIDMSYMV